jgi:hypothetical protein
MKKYLSFIILVVSYFHNLSAQEITLKSLFDSCQNDSKVNSPALLDFFRHYDLINDLTRDPYSNSTQCEYNDSLFFGKMLFYHKDEELVTDYYFIFSEYRKEVHLFFDYPMEFEAAKTSLDHLSEVKIYNFDGELLYEVVIPFFEIEKYTIAIYQYTEEGIYEKVINAQTDSDHIVNMQLPISEYTISDYLDLIDTISTFSALKEGKLLDKEFNWYQLDKRECTK